jgi:hypothetical protein
VEQLDRLKGEPVMATRLEQVAKGRAEKKPARGVEKTALPRSAQEFDELIESVHSHLLDLKIHLAEIKDDRFAMEFEQAARLSPHLPSPAEAGGAALWDKAVASLGRSADVMEELAESTGEAIAHIAARGDRIDRIQKETRALLNALVASEADA